MPIDLDKVVGAELGPLEYTYTETEVILYALGIGFGAKPTDANHLRYVYENGLAVFPTFGVIPPSPGIGQFFALPGLDINFMMLLHGEHKLEIHKYPLPTGGKVVSRGKVSAVYDKQKGALAVMELTTFSDKDEALYTNSVGFYIRGEGGFGGESWPPVGNHAPDREPDLTVEYQTIPQQAAIYRLSGDRNPLHIDPAMAAMGGFDRPILHGLCTYAHVGRAVVDGVCGGDETRLRSLEVRFAKPVFPGETIRTLIWKEGGDKVLMKAVVPERGVDVITNAAATISN